MKGKINKEKYKRKELRDVLITVRVTRSMSKFMKDNKISPSAVINETLKDMGCKEAK